MPCSRILRAELVHPADLARAAIQQRVGRPLVRHAERRAQFGVAFEDLLHLAQVETLLGHLRRDREMRRRDDDAARAGAVLRFGDGVGQRRMGDLAHDRIHAGSEIHFQDVGDLLAVGDVLLDEIVLGRGGVAPAQEPVRADDHARERNAPNGRARETIHCFSSYNQAPERPKHELNTMPSVPRPAHISQVLFLFRSERHRLYRCYNFGTSTRRCSVTYAQISLDTQRVVVGCLRKYHLAACIRTSITLHSGGACQPYFVDSLPSRGKYDFNRAPR